MSGILILGTGLAGYTLAREFRKLDATTPVHLLTANSGCYYSKPSLSNALAQNKDAAQLVLNTGEQMAAQLRAQVTTHVRATSIDTASHTVCTSKEIYRYEKLVLAIGADPIRIDIGGDGAADIVSVNNLDDYARFRERLANSRRVAILGGGLIGCEFANDLRAVGIDVAVVDPGPTPLARFLPAPCGRFFQKALEGAGVHFHLGTTVQSITRQTRGLRLTLTSGISLEADLVLSAVGLRPNTRLASESGIQIARGIAANRFLATSSPDVYTLGDCAEIEGLHLPFVMPIMQAARALAGTLSGTPTAVHYPAMPVVVKTPACPTVLCPPPPGVDGVWSEEDAGDGIRALFHDSSGNVRGFALTGNATQAKQSLLKEMPALLN
ncbi:MAG: FAD-dependent oxidoreductase [Gammaproteobacteria bacterium]|nr:FAD-dependent oxidoreductase [Gammaproteobacteria bacterium]